MPVAQELEGALEEPAQIPAPVGVATPQTKNVTSPTSTIPGTLATMVDSDEEFIDGLASCRKEGLEKKQHGGSTTPPWGPNLQEILPDRQPDSALPEEPSPSNGAPKQNSDGTQSMQPVGYQPEPLMEGLEEIPDIRDAFAPTFSPSEHHLTDSAIRSRAKRIFTPRVDGSKKVSDEIWNDWKAGGSKRRLLQDIFKQCGYDPETWLITGFCWRVFFKGVTTNHQGKGSQDW